MMILEGSRPWVWRRIEVSPFAKLGGLHRVIQAVMGWGEALPHQFILADDIFKRVAPYEALPREKEPNWRLDSALYPDNEFWYVVGEYGEWRHRISLEDFAAGVSHWRYPRCVDGDGASPSGVEKTFSVAAANRRLWRRIGKR